MAEPRSLPARLSRYLAERFPPIPGALTACFLAGAGDLVAQAARAPSAAVVVDVLSLVAILTVLGTLFALRVFDEHKDVEVDRAAHPERPVQRGLVSLRELFGCLVLVSVVVVAANLWAGPTALVALAAVAAVVLVLWRELFVGQWLRRHPLVYLATHQVVVPAMVLYAAVVRGAVSAKELASAPMLLVCTMAVGASVTFEVGRKIRARDDERPAEETYSRALGPAPAALLALGSLLTSSLAALALGASLGLSPVYLVVVGVGSALAAVPFLGFARHPTRERSRVLLGAGALVAVVTYAPLLVAIGVARSLTLLPGGLP